MHINCEDSFACIAMEHDVTSRQLCGLKHPVMTPYGSITPQNTLSSFPDFFYKQLLGFRRRFRDYKEKDDFDKEISILQANL